jgi:hypothetical protein
MKNKILELEEKMDNLREEVSSLLEINSMYECENEDLKIELERLDKKLEYTFNVDTLEKEMKYELLLEIFNKIPLSILEEKLGTKYNLSF